jgi:hypothetical protein
MMTPEAYTKYYHKWEAYYMENNSYGSKLPENKNSPAIGSPYFKNSSGFQGAVMNE